jgi:deoxycytidine triphosphate deaminase
MTQLLCDAEIEEYLRAAPSLIVDFDPAVLATSKSPVKGATLDLTVGQIFVPGAKANKLGGVNKPRVSLSLECGQTAILRSAEKIRMPKKLAGIGFPPSTSASLAGLLSTNPGHIDPDYVGHLHLTVVNMGKENFSIVRGDRMMRVMFFELSNDVHHLIGEPPSPLTEELLGRLSHDFLDIDDRAKKAAKTEEVRIRSWQLWATFAGAALTVGITLGYQVISGQRELTSQVSKMEGRLNTLGGSLNVVSFDEQARKLGMLEERLKSLESAPKKPANNRTGR